MLCPNCRQLIADDADVCVHCGTEFQPLPTWSSYGMRVCQRPGFWIAGIGIALTLFAVGRMMFIEVFDSGPDLLWQLGSLSRHYAPTSWWNPGLLLVALGIAEILVVRMIFDRPRRAGAASGAAQAPAGARENTMGRDTS